MRKTRESHWWVKWPDTWTVLHYCFQTVYCTRNTSFVPFPVKKKTHPLWMESSSQVDTTENNETRKMNTIRQKVPNDRLGGSSSSSLCFCSSLKNAAILSWEPLLGLAVMVRARHNNPYTSTWSTLPAATPFVKAEEINRLYHDNRYCAVFAARGKTKHIDISKWNVTDLISPLLRKECRKVLPGPRV